MICPEFLFNNTSELSWGWEEKKNTGCPGLYTIWNNFAYYNIK